MLLETYSVALTVVRRCSVGEVGGVGRFTVGQLEAVEVLVTKLHGRIADTPARRRLAQAIGRAQTRHHEVGTPDDRGFYHGLLTGYAVAMKVLEGKLNASRRA